MNEISSNNANNSNKTFSFDSSSLSILEKSTKTKPPKFDGVGFSKWASKGKFFLSQVDELKYLTLSDLTLPADLTKSKKTAERIIDLLSEELQTSFFDDKMNACTLWTILESTFNKSESELRATMYKLFKLNAKNFLEINNPTKITLINQEINYQFNLTKQINLINRIKNSTTIIIIAII